MGTVQAVGILERVVAVIPRCLVLNRAEGVGVDVVGGNGALGDTIHSIHLRTVGLSEAVPVNRGTVVLQLVLDRDFDQIAPACLEPWPGIAAVDNLAAGIRDTIGVDCHVVDLEIILAKDTLGPCLFIVSVDVELVAVDASEPVLAIILRRAAIPLVSQCWVLVGDVVIRVGSIRSRKRGIFTP